jgi:dsRNA-specific ribonuclease
LTDVPTLATAAERLGIHQLVRTSEFPPTQETNADALKALVGALGSQRMHSFVCDFILPPISDLALEDVLPFRSPLPILEDYLQAQGYKDIEPRILHSSGVDSAMPLYVVGIYADKKLVGKCKPSKFLSSCIYF